MPKLSQHAEYLIRDCVGPYASFMPDVLVVGSGYGASVAALRFAEHGLRVAVLERGAEYEAQDFPNDLTQLGAFVRAERSNTRKSAVEVTATGYEDALFDFRLGDGASALVGNGLGGGSLINAAVALQPDARVFAQSEWPAAIRQQGLGPYFTRATQGLGIQSAAQQLASQACVPQNTPKYQALAEIARQAQRSHAGDRNLSIRVEPAPLAIHFGAASSGPVRLQACIGCGDCCSGCRHDAKLSLDKTYLARAFEAGARLYTGVTVLSVSRKAVCGTGAPGWELRCVRTSERALWQQAAEARHPVADQYVFTLSAPRVVLGAGAFGSTEILLRSSRQGLGVARSWLGRGISANGDDLSAAYDLPEAAHAVGQGSEVDPSRPVGPTISGVIRFDDASNHRRSTLTEDGAIPGALSPLIGELLGTLAVLPQLARFGLRHPAGTDALVAQPRARSHSLTLLGMGHDSATGVADLSQPWSRLAWAWPKDVVDDPAPALHRQRLKSVEDLGGIFLANPSQNLLPEALSEVLNGPPMKAGWVTVHPLGGCRMADSAGEGVVNDHGEVFAADGTLLSGLMVLDGSIVPSSLGANPMLTITALAERACDGVLKGLPRATSHKAGTCCGQADPAAAVNTALRPVPVAWQAGAPKPPPRGAVLSEVLRGDLHALPDDTGALPAWLKTASSQGLPAALFLDMDVSDWASLWQDARHLVRAVPAAAGSVSFTASRLTFDLPAGNSLSLRVTGGQVELFAPMQEKPWCYADRLVRSILTYFLGRYLPDRSRPKPKLPPAGGFLTSSLAGVRRFFKTAWGGFKLLCHASYARSFHYQLHLQEGAQAYQLRGSKYIEYAASWGELRVAAAHKVTTGCYQRLGKRSVWDQLTQLDVSLLDSTGTVCLAQGRLTMDMPEMLRRVVPQLKPGPDTLHALTAFSSYPLTILRYLMRSRVLDFRAPDYHANLPATDPAMAPEGGRFELLDVSYPPLRMADGRTVPTSDCVGLQVRLRRSTMPRAQDKASECIRIGLVRYAQPKSCWQDTDDGLRRYRSIILINGFALNTLPFVAEELGHQNLASMLYAQGWDVWLLEYRVSPLLRASARFSSLDDIAAEDIPVAVDHVLATLGRESSIEPGLAGQVFVFSHCVGSAALGMSVLGGHLQHADGRSKLAGLLFSQFHPFVIGSATAQSRLAVASAMVNAMGLDYIQFTAGICQNDALHAGLDRLFASFHAEPGECCPGEHDLERFQPDTTTCKRMTGLLSRLFRHDQLVPSQPGQPGTHEKLDTYFGRTNLGVFMQGAKCVEYERLVDEDGQNVYVTDAHVQRFLTMPVMLLQGADNVLFDKESVEESWSQLRRSFSAARLASGLDRKLLVENHAHFDCTIGRNAPTAIFPGVLQFFHDAFSAGVPAGERSLLLRARLPLTGPLAGWVRQELEAGKPKRLLRVWMEVDDSQADESLAAMTLLSCGRQRQVQAWPLSRQPLQSGLGQGASGQAQPQILCAVADIELPENWQGPISVAMVSLHRLHGASSPEVAPEPTGWPADWGQPVRVEEVRNTGGRSPSLPSTFQALRSSLNAASPAAPAPGATVANLPQGPAIQTLTVSVPSRIQPLPMTLTLQDGLAMLRPLNQLLRDRRHRARSADPQTLSRLVRSTRRLRECWLRLSGASLFAPQGLRMVAATCRHPGLTGFEAERSDQSLTDLLAAQQARPAAFMWMLGDQIYADAQAGVLDSSSSLERLLPRYRTAFGSPGFRALASRLPLYMAMDDHEIGDNWSSEQALKGQPSALLADNALAAFAAYQRAHGPQSQGPGGHDYAFEQGGVAFLSLNTRIHRSRVPNRQILDSGQWTLLAQWLAKEQAKGDHPKFLVTGSVLAPGLQEAAGALSPRQSDTWQMSAPERARLLGMVRELEVRNLVFLSGDYHCNAYATIRFSDSEIKAHCLVSPSLHAPMRFANVAAQDVLLKESIALPDGSTATVCDGEAWNGDGWLEVNYLPGATTGRLQALFHTQAMDSAPRQTRSVRLV